jgi:hypothetical protein
MNGLVRKVTDILVRTLGVTLCVGFLCGIINVLVDFDHPISFAFGIENARFLHPYYFALSSGILFGCFSYVGGLLIKSVLRREEYA